MGIISISIRRPLTMAMVIISITIIGIRAYGFLQLSDLPEVDIPVVTITTIYSGASPEDVEDLIVKPIEDAVAGISGIDQLTGRASEGYGAVIIEFKDGVDGNAAAIDVERQVATVRNQLPDDAEDPTISKVDINAAPVLELVLNGPQSQDALFDVADNYLKDQLQSVTGVASVEVTGGRTEEIQINIDPERLAAYGLTIGQVQQALQVNNVTFPAGSLEEGRSKMSIRSVGEFESLDDIRAMVVAGDLNDPDKLGLIYLRDVATVERGYKDQSTILRYNGAEAINLTVVKNSDANTVSLVDEVLKKLPTLNDRLPPGSSVDIVADNSKGIRDSVEAVENDLVSAVLITGIVMLVFLQNARSTLIVLLTLPTSIISTFTIMWLMGFTLDNITLLALTLIIGILVDDAIVLIENVDRHVTEYKKPPMQAAFDACTQIALAAASISLVTVVIYVPVAFISGIIGQIFFSYGITIASASLISLFMSFVMVPMLSSRWMEDKSRPQGRPTGLRRILGIVFYPIAMLWKLFTTVWNYIFDLLSRFYALTLRFFLWNFITQFLAIAIAAGALAAGMWLVVSGLIGGEFLPTSDQGRVAISLEMPPGTNLEATDLIARQIERAVLQEAPNEVTGLLTKVGAGEGGGPGAGGVSVSNRATFDIRLVDKELRDRSDQDLANDLRPLLQHLPEATISLQAGESGGPPGQAIVVRLTGADKSVLIDIAHQVEDAILSVEGAADVTNSDAVQAVETQFLIDRTKARDLGLAPQDIAFTLRTALNGSDVGEFKQAGATDLDITVRLAEESRLTTNQLLNLVVGYQEGNPVTLSQVVVSERDLAPASINRYNRQIVLEVGAGTSDRAVGDVADDVEAAINERVKFPVGYGFEFAGNAEFQREAFAEMTSALGLSIILIYLLLVGLYQSFLQPLAIMFALPVTLVGAFGGLYLTGNTLNLISLLGIILLAGVVTKNAILLVDFTNTLREQDGLPRKEALIQAGKLRLRAILMTTCTLVFALLPLLLGDAAGSELRRPMAAVVIGGMISSTVLTLILVPVVYNFFDWGSGVITSVAGWVWGSEQPVEQPIDTDEDPEADNDGEVDPKPEPEPRTKPEPEPRPQPRQQPLPQPGAAMSAGN